MYVFKAAVVGAGTMGGEIAQVIASAGIPVVLKDVEQKFVDQGLEKAQEVTQGQLGGLVKKEKITQEDADQQLEEIIGRITGRDRLRRLRRRRLRGRGRAGADGDQAGGLRRARRGHARPRDPRPRTPAPLSISEMAEATSRPDKVVGFHFFYPASMMRLIEVIEGDETSEETLQAAANFAQQIRKTADPLRRGARASWSTASSTRRCPRSGGCRRRRASTSRRSTRSSRSRRSVPMGPFFLSDLLGLDTVLHVAEHLQESYGDRFYVSPKLKELVEAGQPRPEDRKGLL